VVLSQHPVESGTGSTGTRLPWFLLPGCRLDFQSHYRRSRSGVLRQQLKWLTGGTLAGKPAIHLAVHRSLHFDAATLPWMQFSALVPGADPLCFGYAIIRYRLMDVTLSSSAAWRIRRRRRGGSGLFRTGALIAQIFHEQTTGSVGGMIAIVVAAFLFQPFREGIQARLDRFFYRDRLDYRRTLIDLAVRSQTKFAWSPCLAR